jgi:outer membrane immunogenic protein
MKKILLMTVAFAALGMGPAGAADLAARTYTKAPPIAALPTWAGFYIGAMGGYASEDASDFGMKGGFAGGTAGYNWQMGNLVLGVEADAAWADISASASALGVSAESKIRDMGTVRGRVGYAVDQVLFYGTAGFAWADNRISVSVPGLSASDSQIHTGWVAGAGVEYMFAPHWSLKGEYLYRSFGGESYTFPVVGTFNSGTLNLHSGQVGVNYHF